MGDKNRVQAEFEFELDRFGDDAANLMILGLFHSDRIANRSSVTLRMSGKDSATIVVAGDTGTLESKPIAGLKAGRKYQFKIVLSGPTRRCDICLTDLTVAKVMCEIRGEMPDDIKGLRFDEIGVAQPDWNVTSTVPEKSH